MCTRAGYGIEPTDYIAEEWGLIRKYTAENASTRLLSRTPRVIVKVVTSNTAVYRKFQCHHSLSTQILHINYERTTAVWLMFSLSQIHQILIHQIKINSFLEPIHQIFYLYSTVLTTQAVFGGAAHLTTNGMYTSQNISLCHFTVLIKLLCKLSHWFSLSSVTNTDAIVYQWIYYSMVSGHWG